MIKAAYKDKETIVNILTRSFDDNKSVNYIIKQDKRRIKKIQSLMAYSFEVCYTFGEIYYSKDRTGCALILFPDKKKPGLKSFLLDLQLIVSSIGLGRLKKALTREAKIKKRQVGGPLYYLWFIGVEPEKQNMGTGTKLLQELIQQARFRKRTLCLETSTVINIPWYEKAGLRIYNQLDLGYVLFFLKKD